MMCLFTTQFNIQNNLDELDPDNPMVLPQCTSDSTDIAQLRTEVTGMNINIWKNKSF